MREAVIVDAVRTPIGKYKGNLKYIRPDDLGALVIKALIERNPALPPSAIEEVVMGNANQAGEDNRNVARMSSLLAELPVEVAGTTINRLCGSGLDAINYAARAILAGEGDIFIAGGTESMTRAPMVMAKPQAEFPRGNMEIFDTTIGWRFINEKLQSMYGTESMPETAENVARHYQISRVAQDEFAALSQARAQRAIEAGYFEQEIIPIVYRDKKGKETIIDRDEHPRAGTSVEKLAQLKPLFNDGTVTAGNASGVNDGASALLIVERKTAEKLGLKPFAKYIVSAAAGIEPSIMGMGPVNAVQKALQRAGLTMKDIDLVELNEAFAAQSLACISELGLNIDQVNVNGGAIAFGHPLGASGARIMTTLLYEMKKRGLRYGLATMCVGVGQGIATIIKNIEET